MAGEGYILAASPMEYNSNNVAETGAITLIDSTTRVEVGRIESPLVPIGRWANADQTTQCKRFGEAVAIQGGKVFVGAPRTAQHDQIVATVLNSSCGIVVVYDLATLTQEGVIRAPYTDLTVSAGTYTNSSYFGQAIAVSNTHIAITAAQDPGNISNMGAVYVYDRASYGLLYKIVNPTVSGGNTGNSVSDNFGAKVQLTADYLIVSAPGEDVTGAVDGGVVYIFDVATGELLQVLNKPDAVSASYAYGNDLRVVGSKLLVGNRAGNTYGQVYEYQLS